MRPGLVVAAALAAAAIASTVAGSAGAQGSASITVLPAEADPGASVMVTDGPSSPCPPPSGTASPSASVDLYAIGSATPANRMPYQASVTPAGTWTVEVKLAPDLPPGTYRVQAGCYTDSGLNAGFGPAYDAGRLQVRQQALGSPTSSVVASQPGDSVQVVSGDVRCTPPAGATSPRVRVSLLDATRATRAESEGAVDAATGRWSVSLTVPSIAAQDAQIGAVCLARVGASVPYARYAPAPFEVEADPSGVPPLTGPPFSGPTSTPPSSAPGAPGAPTTATTALESGSLPMTPLAKPVVAEPTYTG